MILLKLQSRKYKYVTYLVALRRGARFLYFFTVQLTSIVNYKLPTNILFNSSARYWQISLPVAQCDEHDPPLSEFR